VFGTEDNKATHDNSGTAFALFSRSFDLLSSQSLTGGGITDIVFYDSRHAILAGLYYGQSGGILELPLDGTKDVAAIEGGVSYLALLKLPQ
jgi:hypothetical protein